MITGKRVFITGGAGFIGSTLVGRLVDDNEIAIYDIFRRDALSDKSCARHPNLKIVTGDILDTGALARAMAGARIVIRCRAVVRRTRREPRMNRNSPLFKLIELCRTRLHPRGQWWMLTKLRRLSNMMNVDSDREVKHARRRWVPNPANCTQSELFWLGPRTRDRS